jgi:hypothetical protein
MVRIGIDSPGLFLGRAGIEIDQATPPTTDRQELIRAGAVFKIGSDSDWFAVVDFAKSALGRFKSQRL